MAIPQEEQSSILIIPVLRGLKQEKSRVQCQPGLHSQTLAQSRKQLQCPLTTSLLSHPLSFSSELRKAGEPFIRYLSLSQDSTEQQAYSAQANSPPFLWGNLWQFLHE